jgi:hypothetical protein
VECQCALDTPLAGSASVVRCNEAGTGGVECICDGSVRLDGGTAILDAGAEDAGAMDLDGD